MGGKSSDNSAMINEQKAQAAEARAKEAARQSRINQGLQAIKAAFTGGPIMGTRAVAPATWSGTGDLPAGYTRVGTVTPGAATPPASRQYIGGSRESAGGTRSSGQAAPHEMNVKQPASNKVNTGKFAIRGPDGRIIQPGQSFGGGEEVYDTGQRGTGFDDKFYNEYRQGVLDYYNPQVQEQYGDAKDELTYRLARAGTLKSSAAAKETADLAEQNRLNAADVQAKADAGAAELRSRVAAEQAKAESQLYATENPEVATNQALAAVRNISLAKPELSPLGEIFKVAAIGGANAVTGYRSQNLINQIPGAYRKKDTTIVGA